MSKTVKIYANAKQIKFLRSRAKRKTFQGGRGSGKTTTLGNVVGMMFENLPRAKVVLVGLTYVQLDLIVMPELKNALSRMGYVEFNKSNPHGVYVIGQQPPDAWYKAFASPGKKGWQYCISFINGFTLQLVSQDRPDSQRGINNDGVLVDESATVNPDFLNTIILPAKRANRRSNFAHHPLHLCYYDFSSAAWTNEGMWIYETEALWMQEMAERATWSDQQLIDTPPEYLFLQSSWKDNADVLPERYYDDLVKLLPPLTLAVEVDNERITQRPNGFYGGFSTAKHNYTKSHDYEFDEKTKLHLHRSKDYREDVLLETSLDFNADICWQVIGQEVGNEFRTIESVFRKPNPLQNDTNLVVQLADYFVETYKNHPKKEVAVWGDPSGKQRSARDSKDNKPLFEQYCNVLIKAGWSIRREYERFTYPTHKDKYVLIDYLLRETSDRTPRLRFNQYKNKPLIIAIQMAPMKGDFEKDKASETSSNQTNREYATDGTDAWDYMIWGKYRKLMPSSRPAGMQNQIWTPGRRA
ncbi:hypothetical protein [Siphonobacter sp. SORGH_AS_0500]|uniref:hypothetical protein n=1 Tax=Siphonobacter sp. SORGH_AS_0500 TaxID=1864824 RepID=UPI00286031DC|nr:hypothetical protein [Siphonobacter sp. SORGH_AS_0500]MDR6195179.1 hypothetical protein [Siphonobacter sp. SORGH_AS_0500]